MLVTPPNHPLRTHTNTPFYNKLSHSSQQCQLLKRLLQLTTRKVIKLFVQNIHRSLFRNFSYVCVSCHTFLATSKAKGIPNHCASRKWIWGTRLTLDQAWFSGCMVGIGAIKRPLFTQAFFCCSSRGTPCGLIWRSLLSSFVSFVELWITAFKIETKTEID